MLYFSIGIFALAAVMGLIILKSWMTAAETSRTVVYAHGIAAALALVLLLLYMLQYPSQTVQASFGLFVLAAIAGFFMFFRDLKGKFSPTWLAIVHGLVAVSGFVLLLFLLM